MKKILFETKNKVNFNIFWLSAIKLSLKNNRNYKERRLRDKWLITELDIYYFSSELSMKYIPRHAQTELFQVQKRHSGN